ncbi:porin PorA family protein [Cryptosporangium minutisporangium]|uniref:DUF3068 domain-containing protein n=1 Tax=Cryptosporangium minutisporangium TaxID=113569 RepID=A0ABP6SRU3_9ACTN
MAAEPESTATETSAPPDEGAPTAGPDPVRPKARGALVAGVLALVVGLALLVAALLLPLVVYPRVAVLPDDPGGPATSTARGATLLVPDRTSPIGLKEVRGLQLTSTTVMKPGPRPDDGDSVVWEMTTTTTAAGIGPLGPPVAERVSIDRRTGETTNCCDDRIGTSLKESESRPVQRQGYFAWPFDVQKRDYPFWDGTIGRTWPMAYVREERRDGFDTYVFEAKVPRQKTGVAQLPGALFGRPEPVVQAESWYTRTTTSWIEPSTGAPIASRDQRTQGYTFAGRTVTAFAATMESGKMTDSRRDEVRTGARWLPWARGRAAYVLVPLGLVFLAVGVVLLRRRAVARRISAAQS